jgi:hypothetical protein
VAVLAIKGGGDKEEEDDEPRVSVAGVPSIEESGRNLYTNTSPIIIKSVIGSIV